jgi:predicted esterase
MAAGVLAVLSAACAFEPSNRPIRELPADMARSIDDRAPAFSAEGAASPIALPAAIERVPVLPHLSALAIAGFPDAAVAPPWSLETPRPVLVVLHGLGDRPETHCEAFRKVLHASAFVLCLRGALDPERSAPGRTRYTLPGGDTLRAHVDAALQALEARYGDRVDIERPLLAGFSLGATEAALLAQWETARFPRVAVLEGGLDVWDYGTIAAFAQHGGVRVLFGCGSPWCTPPARAAIDRIRANGGGGTDPARLAFADVGHRDSPPLQAAVRAELAWFVEGDPRWEPLAENDEP